MRFRLRTLLIALALGPLVLWAVWIVWRELGPNQGFFVPQSVDYSDGRGPQSVQSESP